MKARSQLEKQGKSEQELDERFAELVGPEINPAGEEYLRMFFQLSATRQAGMNGPTPITYLEIKAYAELNDIELVPQDVNILKQMDKAYLQEVGKLSEEQT